MTVLGLINFISYVDTKKEFHTAQKYAGIPLIFFIENYY